MDEDRAVKIIATQAVTRIREIYNLCQKEEHENEQMADIDNYEWEVMSGVGNPDDDYAKESNSDNDENNQE